jgi:putative ABC transport system substrate-binding protein
MDDPVELGVIESYNRPGGNTTGVFNVNAALSAKRLEILKDTLPDLRRVALLWDAFSKRQIEEAQGAARTLKIQLDLIETKDVNGMEEGFKSAKALGAGAVLMNFSPVFWANRNRLVEIAIETGMPTMSDIVLMAHNGCMLAYGSDGAFNWERGAYSVNRVIKGANPADLPVERLSRLKLVVNLNTAEALGVTIPPSILLRADEVIE